jgi:hypothetical protein
MRYFAVLLTEEFSNPYKATRIPKNIKKHLFRIHIRLSIQIKACIFSSDDINVDTI